MAYTDIAGVRAASAGDDVSDVATFPSALVTTSIVFAEELIDEATMTSFEAKVFTATMTGDGSCRLRLTDADIGRWIVYPRSITAVTIDGTSQASSVWAKWVLDPLGIVTRDTGTFPTTTTGRNITIVGTAGRTTTVPKLIKLAAELIARDYLLSQHDRTSQRALQRSDEFGTTVFAQPGKYGLTGIPQVNKILDRFSAALPAVA